MRFLCAPLKHIFSEKLLTAKAAENRREVRSENLYPTNVPAPAPVQNAEPSFDESLTKLPPPFSTALSTIVLKTFGQKKSRH
jgi:hypothetical protein